MRGGADLTPEGLRAAGPWRGGPRPRALVTGLEGAAAVGSMGAALAGPGWRFYDAGMGADPAGAGLAVRLLGPVEIGRASGAAARVAQPQQRVLLGLLTVAAGRMVSAEALVDGVWGEEWSPRREGNLHVLVYQLRRRLAALEPEEGQGRGGGRLARAGGGYQLAMGAGELDVAVFQDLAERGRAAARAGDTAAARELFETALALWRGAALADAADLCPPLAGEAARLEEARLAVVEERIGCDLALSRHHEVAGELAALVVRFPLREQLAGLLMIALYRCGRRGDALAVYDTTRRTLAGELGLDPGPELAGLQARVLADDPALAVPRAAAPGLVAGAGGAAPAVPVAMGAGVPRQLPAGAGFFAGREAELKELDALLGLARPDGADADGGLGTAVVISAIGGMAGVGKTALAVHWARRVAGQFPDGQLYVNLRGYDRGPAVTPEEVTGWFLAALGVPAPQIPAGAAERAGLYRSVLAGRRVLIVLDNAADPSQVRPLLPGSPGCLVVVTSRSALVGLAAAEGARPLRLAPLGAQEAARLLAARLGPERVAAEPEAVTDLIGWSGGLPLALAVLAARAAADPGLPLRALAAQLAGVPDAVIPSPDLSGAAAGPTRLQVLETGDAATSLAELLSWSHRQLSPPAAAMFALLGVHCGPDVTIPAAASLVGVPVAAARQAMGELADASLVAGHRPGRYVMHDLVRDYAAGLARQALGVAGIREAIARCVGHYLHTMVISYPFPRPFTPAPPALGVVPERIAGRQRADWARAEHQVLLRATAQAAAAGMLTDAWQIFNCLTWILADQGYWADCQAAGQAVLAAAESAGNHAALGWTHTIITIYCSFIGAYHDGHAHHVQARDHFRRAGDLTGQAWADLSASMACGWAGNWADGAALAEQALALFGQAGIHDGEGWALHILAEYHAQLGNNKLARGYARQALEAGSQIGDPTAAAYAWKALGLVHSRLGEQQQAISCYQQALALARKWRTPLARRWLAGLLVNFGDACRAAGDPPAAASAWRHAQQILDDLHLSDDLGVRARLRQTHAHRRPS
jgi:DNA-binding SARP family transcriptional activator/tetratricopeptide (TPR) repeat protein